jgi:lysophospholipase L1-like esterase
MVKGYYEDLLGTEGWGSMLWSVRLEEPEDWKWGGAPTESSIRETGTMRGGVYYPDLDVVHKGAAFRTNRWGLRDEDFELEKTAGTCRIVLLGSSYADGAGVEMEATFGEQLEDRFREEPLSDACADTQVLNFSFPGDSIVRQVAALQRNAVPFQPDAVLVVATTNEALHAVRNARDSVLQEVPDMDPEIQTVLDRAGIVPGMSAEEVERRLNAHSDELLASAYRALARTAAEHGLDVLWFLLPLTDDDDRRYEESYAHLSAMVKEAGLVPVNLAGVYGDLNERDQVRLAPWDWHPNREGHSRIAERMEREIRERSFLGRSPQMRRPG